MKKIKNIVRIKIFRHSFIYIVAEIMNKGLPFILLPILTRYLTPEDYGIIASFQSLLGILAVIIGLSVHGAVTVNYYKLSKAQLSIFIGNVFFILLCSTSIASLSVFLLRIPMENLFKLPFQWILSAIIVSFATFLVTINLSLWIAEQKPKSYGTIRILDTILKLGLSLWFVIVLSFDWRGRILAILIGTIIMASVNVILLIRRGYLHLTFSKAHIFDALRFGTPLIPHQLSNWLRTGAIILILLNMVGEAKTGLYDVGAKFAMIISVTTMAFNKAYQPFLFRKLKSVLSNKEKEKIVRYSYLSFIVILLGALLITILSPLLIKWIIGKEFIDAYIYVGYLSFAAAFQGMFFVIVAYIYYEKKTQYLAYITFIVSAIHILLAYVLIKINGSIGAAQASLISFGLSFISVWYFSNKVYNMPWMKVLQGVSGRNLKK